MLKDASLARGADPVLPRRLQPRLRRGPPRPKVNVAEVPARPSSKGWVSRILKVLAPLTAGVAAAGAASLAVAGEVSIVTGPRREGQSAINKVPPTSADCGTCGQHAVVDSAVQPTDGVTIRLCRQCTKPVCSICRVLSDCPKCYVDLKDYDDVHGHDHAALVPRSKR